MNKGIGMNDVFLGNITIVFWSLEEIVVLLQTKINIRTDMNNDLIIAKVEQYYQQYFEQESVITSNGFTDFFFDKLNSIPLCKRMLDELEKNPHIQESLFRNRENLDIDEFIWDLLREGERYYVAYCYKYYRFLRKDKLECPNNSKEYFFDDVKWTEKSYELEGDKLQLFKKGFVRPIVDYLVGNLTSESVILHTLERYKARVERFKSLAQFDISNLHEKDIQRELALYLFDNKIVFSKEDDTSNGKLDFLISSSYKDCQYGSILECNDKPYIVEVKLYKEETDLAKLKNAIKQLNVYMGQKPAYGCLIVYTTDNTDFDFPPKCGDINVMTIYLGDKYPCERKPNKHLLELD